MPPHSVCRLGTFNEGRISAQRLASCLQTRERCFKRWPTATRAVREKREFFHRLRIGIANCCAGKKFRSTVGLGSFPFRYKRAGVERRGKNSEASDVPLRLRVRSPSSPLDGTFAGTVPGEAEVGETIGSLSRQEGVPGDEALTAVWSAAPRERRDMTARTQ